MAGWFGTQGNLVTAGKGWTTHHGARKQLARCIFQMTRRSWTSHSNKNFRSFDGFLYFAFSFADLKKLLIELWWLGLSLRGSLVLRELNRRSWFVALGHIVKVFDRLTRNWGSVRFMVFLRSIWQTSKINFVITNSNGLKLRNVCITEGQLSDFFISKNRFLVQRRQS